MGTQIHSIKHVIDTEGTLVAATDVNVQLATAVTTRSEPFNPVEIEVGETVNAFYISIFIIGQTGAPVNAAQNWYIAKLRGGQGITAAFPNPGNTGPSDVRNQIFHEEKGLVGSGDGTAMAFKGVIVVPRGMRRVREGDEFFIKLRNNDATDVSVFCLKSIYKSFS